MVTVSGTVTFQGEPVPQGDIFFKSLDSSIGTYAGKVVDGHYSFDCRLGEKTVEIRGYREIPGKFVYGSGGKKPAIEMFIPRQYNTRSELTADVTPTSTEHNFDLTP